MDKSDQVERLVAAAREMQSQDDTAATMRLAADLARQYVPSCDAAAISQVHRRGRITTEAFTDDTALAGDVLQYELGQGPCLEAIWEQQIVHSADLREEERWPDWAPRMARDHHVRAMICFRLYTQEDTLGALNLYSLTPRAFDTADRDEGIALAAHIAVAVAGAQREGNLTAALDTRTIIGQATGILMERHDLNPERAFAVLARISSHRNMKVQAVAHHLVTTRELLDTPAPAPGEADED